MIRPGHVPYAEVLVPRVYGAPAGLDRALGDRYGYRDAPPFMDCLGGGEHPVDPVLRVRRLMPEGAAGDEPVDGRIALGRCGVAAQGRALQRSQRRAVRVHHRVGMRQPDRIPLVPGQPYLRARPEDTILGEAPIAAQVVEVSVEQVLHVPDVGGVVRLSDADRRPGSHGLQPWDSPPQDNGP